ncbi:MAG: PIN domain-containing protein [Bacteroidales bacterium]|nr:PIN domain-containing protein [Bacteroidales bacterium]
MRVFLDTNVLLDAIVVRSDPHLCENAATILALGEQRTVELYMSVISIPTIAYVLKNMTAEAKKSVIRDLTSIVAPLPSLAGHVSNMLGDSMPDIEDSLQVQSAREGGCELLITRNCKDFQSCGLPVITPEEFLKRIIG